MSAFLPSPQQILIYVVEHGTTVLPWVAGGSLVASVWAWRRPGRWRRFALGGALALMTICALVASLFSYTVRAELRERTLQLHFRTLDEGQQHSVADWRGKVVVVNYWATWCLPCRREMPALAQLARTYPQTVAVLTLSDESPETIRRWSETAVRATHRGVFATTSPGGGLASVVLQWRPVTLVLDRDARVRRVFLGPQSFVQLKRAVTELR